MATNGKKMERIGKGTGIEKKNPYVDAKFIPNNVSEELFNNIYQAKELVDNIIRYGDPAVYKKIPDYIAKDVEKYGISIKNLCDDTENCLKSDIFVMHPADYHHCCKCGRYKGIKNFYKTNSDISDGYSRVCKECLLKIFEEYIDKYKDIREVLILIAYKLDLYVFEEILSEHEKAFSVSEHWKLLDSYATRLYEKSQEQEYKSSVLTFENTSLGGIPFKCTDKLFNESQIYNDKLVSGDSSNQEDEASVSGYQVKKLRSKFGDYSTRKLLWLEDKYKEWEAEFDLSQLNTRKLIVQMCCDELLIVEQREKGEDVSKLHKNFMETMKALNLTPKQQAKKGSVAGFATLGDFIKEVEKNKPFINKDPEFEDVDRVEKIWRSIAGAISRTLGRSSEYVDEFEKNYSKFSSSELSDGDQTGE